MYYLGGLKSKVIIADRRKVNRETSRTNIGKYPSSESQGIRMIARVTGENPGKSLSK